MFAQRLRRLSDWQVVRTHAGALSTRLLRRLFKRSLVRARMFHPQVQHRSLKPAYVSTGIGISRQMAQRLADAYIVAAELFTGHGITGHGTSFWADNDARNADVISALRSRDLDAITAIANDPNKYSLFWGIDGSAFSSGLYIAIVGDSLLRLAEAVGAIPIWYPEAHFGRRRPIKVDDTLDAIERRIGLPVDFPNPFPNEMGIQTARGIASYRAFQSIYQAWRLQSLRQMINGSRVVEIGPGLGRTAYYAYRFGITDYTTVDLPLGTIAQACFLCRALSEDAIALPGEKARPGQIRLETPAWFSATDETFDIALNVDSMTEMAADVASAYTDRIIGSARVFISINHEINHFRVIDLPALKAFPSQRFPYWLRKGYAEEQYLIAKPRG